MSFDNLKLPDNVIASLYTAPVYSMEQSATAGQQSEKNSRQPLPVLGNNEKLTTLVVNYPNEAFLPDRHLAFIAKMLQACKMTLADVAIINNKNNDWGYREVTEKLSPAQLLLFGMEPAAIGLPVAFPDLTVQVYNGCKLLHAPTLDMLNQETDEATPLKKRLWNCLKQMFPIS